MQSENNHKVIDGIEILTNKTSSITTNNNIEEKKMEMRSIFKYNNYQCH